MFKHKTVLTKSLPEKQKKNPQIYAELYQNVHLKSFFAKRAQREIPSCSKSLLCLLSYFSQRFVAFKIR